MTVVGICMVKNEQDIIEMTLRHFIAEELDKIIIYNNLSSDSTEEILWTLKTEFPDILEIRQDDHFPYNQELKMNQWIWEAHRDFKADWIIPFDADEIWKHVANVSLKDFLLNSEHDVIYSKVFDMIPFQETNTTKPSRDILYRQATPEIHPVVMFKYDPEAWLLQGNHYVRHPSSKVIDTTLIEVCHFQYRSIEQYITKLRNGKRVYDATSLDHSIGQHWRDGGALSAEQLLGNWIAYCNQEGTVLQPCYPKGQK